MPNISKFYRLLLRSKTIAEQAMDKLVSHYVSLKLDDPHALNRQEWKDTFKAFHTLVLCLDKLSQCSPKKLETLRDSYVQMIRLHSARQDSSP